MKVISIKQPWASLIINGYKEYEFRSWKTNFRGNCLIHTSLGIDKSAMDRFKHLNLDYPLGKIIGSVDVVDCIIVDKAFETKLLNKDKIIYGGSINRTGYAFKLKNIKKFKETIAAKGQLGFWNYKK